MEEYRKKGILALITVLQDNDAVVRYEELPEKREREVEDSVLQCRRCKSNKVISSTRQTRGGDEGATVFATCTNCSNKWITHG